MPKRSNNNRKYPDGSSPRPDLSSIKRAEAKERQEYYDKLTIPQKLEALDKKFGVDLGAKKQRARLNTLLNKNTAPKSSVVPAIPSELLSEIDALNNAASEKKKLKAKERRAMEKGVEPNEEDL